MRYRLEQLPNDKLVIRNVETDLILGSAAPVWMDDPGDPDRWIISAYTILNRKGDEITTVGPPTIRRPLEIAAIAVASHEKHTGYPGFKKCGGSRRPQLDRIECLLGTLLADAVSEIARALMECGNAGLKPKTKRKCAKLIERLYAIYYVSSFGSFNGERWAKEPYFANIPPSGPRLSFAAAAETHGMFELRTRYPDLSEAELRLALSWPLEMLQSMTAGLVQDDKASSQRATELVPNDREAAIELACQRRVKEALAVISAQPEGHLH